MEFLTIGLIILVMLVANGVFAAYEMALAAVSRSRLEVLAKTGARGHDAALFMKEQIEASLAVVQLGITLAGVIAAATGGAGVAEYAPPVLMRILGVSDTAAQALAIIFFVIPLSLLTIVFAELVPKMLALNNPADVVLRLSPFMRWLYYAAYPAIKVLEGVVKWAIRQGPAQFSGAAPAAAASLHELHAATALARVARLIGPLEERIVRSAVQLSARTVANVMLPPHHMAMIPVSSSLAEALVLAHLHMHTRYPVCARADAPDTVTGYVTFKDIVSALAVNPTEPSLNAITRTILRLPESMNLATALETMIREKEHIALVVDSSAANVGLLTLEDIIEELVGQIGDEYDRPAMHVHKLPAGWIVGGGVSMGKICELLGVPAPEVVRAAPSMSLDDWCHHQRHGAVQNADLICADGLEIRVRKTRRQRVAEAVVRPLPPSPVAATARAEA